MRYNLLKCGTDFLFVQAFRAVIFKAFDIGMANGAPFVSAQGGLAPTGHDHYHGFSTRLIIYPLEIGVIIAPQTQSFGQRDSLQSCIYYMWQLEGFSYFYGSLTAFLCTCRDLTPFLWRFSRVFKIFPTLQGILPNSDHETRPLTPMILGMLHRSGLARHWSSSRSPLIIVFGP